MLSANLDLMSHLNSALQRLNLSFHQMYSIVQPSSSIINMPSNGKHVGGYWIIACAPFRWHAHVDWHAGLGLTETQIHANYWETFARWLQTISWGHDDKRMQRCPNDQITSGVLERGCSSASAARATWMSEMRNAKASGSSLPQKQKSHSLKVHPPKRSSLSIKSWENYRIESSTIVQMQVLGPARSPLKWRQNMSIRQKGSSSSIRKIKNL